MKNLLTLMLAAAMTIGMGAVQAQDTMKKDAMARTR